MVDILASEYVFYLMTAIILKEDCQDVDRPGRYGEIGPMQITQCVIHDVNDHYGREYTLDDVKDEGIAREVCRLYWLRWAPRMEHKLKRKATLRDLARIWHRGPNACSPGRLKYSEEYSEHVMNLFDEVLKENEIMMNPKIVALKYGTGIGDNKEKRDN